MVKRVVPIRIKLNFDLFFLLAVAFTSVIVVVVESSSGKEVKFASNLGVDSMDDS